MILYQVEWTGHDMTGETGQDRTVLTLVTLTTPSRVVRKYRVELAGTWPQEGQLQSSLYWQELGTLSEACRP